MVLNAAMSAKPGCEPSVVDENTTVKDIRNGVDILYCCNISSC